MHPHQQRRQKRLVTGFQRKLCLQFVSLAALALVIQFLYLSARLTQFATALSSREQAPTELLPRLLLETFAISAVVVLPLLFLLAVSATFRIAGPLVGLERYLRRFASGEESGPYRIRRGDDLGTLPDALNVALDVARQAGKPEAASSDRGAA